VKEKVQQRSSFSVAVHSEGDSIILFQKLGPI
jgi:hypothetical protein